MSPESAVHGFCGMYDRSRKTGWYPAGILGMGKRQPSLPYIKLVGGFNPSEKYYIVNWDDDSQYMENKKYSKPPTRKDIHTPSGFTARYW